MRITINDHYLVATEWPLMRQLNAMKCKFQLTSNDPYPCFMVTWGSHVFLFTSTGETVNTMMGPFKSFRFDEVADVRDLIPSLRCKEGWE